MAFLANTIYAADPLPSWNDGAVKQSVVNFVTKITKEGSPDFVPPGEHADNEAEMRSLQWPDSLDLEGE